MGINYCCINEYNEKSYWQIFFLYKLWTKSLKPNSLFPNKYTSKSIKLEDKLLKKGLSCKLTYFQFFWSNKHFALFYKRILDWWLFKHFFDNNKINLFGMPVTIHYCYNNYCQLIAYPVQNSFIVWCKLNIIILYC